MNRLALKSLIIIIIIITTTIIVIILAWNIQDGVMNLMKVLRIVLKNDIRKILNISILSDIDVSL